MSGTQPGPSTQDDIRAALVGLTSKVDKLPTMIAEARQEMAAGLARLSATVLPALAELKADVDQLRVVSLGKIDHMQGSLDLLRQDVHTNWATADFAISNSRSGRQDVDKLLIMVAAMQRSQQLLTAQVEELRKGAQERDAKLG